MRSGSPYINPDSCIAILPADHGRFGDRTRFARKFIGHINLVAGFLTIGLCPSMHLDELGCVLPFNLVGVNRVVDIPPIDGQHAFAMNRHGKRVNLLGKVHDGWSRLGQDKVAGLSTDLTLLANIPNSTTTSVF